jgi:hypothetical protein
MVETMGRRPFRVAMRRDGELLDCAALEFYDIDPPDPSVEIFNAGDGLLRSWFRVWAWATDEKHAVKIANERRAQLIASNEWPPDVTPGSANSLREQA